MKIKTVILIALLIFVRPVFSQGFINLSFESAKLVTDPSQGAPFVYASNAIPGWTPYIGGVAQDYIASNGISGGGALINIEGTNNSSGFPPIQGSYFILLQGAGFAHTASAAIGQTAQIPTDAQSMSFWGNMGEMQILFGGQALSFSAIGSIGGIYTIYQTDISQYAGQTGQLLFSNPNYDTYGIIDNIQFSANAVPEPGELSLSALGGILFYCRCWKRLKPKP